MAKARTPEGEVLSGALELLKLRGVVAVRFNTGALKTPSGGFIRFGAVGAPDIWGAIPWAAGRMILVEVKAPKGKPRPNQVEFLERMRAAGAVAVWLDDLGRLDAILGYLRRDPEASFTIDGRLIPERLPT